jgi:hypothetical protein
MQKDFVAGIICRIIALVFLAKQKGESATDVSVAH